MCTWRSTASRGAHAHALSRQREGALTTRPPPRSTRFVFLPLGQPAVAAAAPDRAPAFDITRAVIRATGMGTRSSPTKNAGIYEYAGVRNGGPRPVRLAQRAHPLTGAHFSGPGKPCFNKRGTSEGCV